MSDKGTRERPISPFMLGPYYRLQLTSVLSFTHRLTGMFLCLGTLPLIYWLLALAAGPEAYSSAVAVLSHPLMLVLLVSWCWSLFYHLLNGIRHLCWDAGWLLELKGAYASGWIVLALSVILTAIVWGAAL